MSCIISVDKRRTRINIVWFKEEKRTQCFGCWIFSYKRPSESTNKYLNSTLTQDHVLDQLYV